MSWVAVAVGGAAVVGAVSQNSASNKAAGAQKNAANAAIAQTEQNYNRTEQNLNPYIDAGKNALSQINSLNAGDYSSFNASPDYQFALNQGLQGLDRSAAARGSLYSGGHDADVMGYAQGLASQNYNNYYSKLAGLAQQGYGAASNLGSVGTGNAAAIGGYLQNAGNASADAALAQGNQWANLGNQLAGAYGQYQSGYIPPIPQSSYAAPSYNSGSLAGNGVQVNDLAPTRVNALYPKAY